MKTFLILALLVALSSAALNYEKVKEHCSKKAGIDVAVIDKAWKDKQFPAVDGIKEYTLCSLEQLNCINADGVVSLKSVKEDCESYKKFDCSFFDKCEAEKGNSALETAAAVYSCVMESYNLCNN
ncbi:uncharacterized protein LOC116178216 [Photinus pyralis]|uniref:uncharacterized protein LOC116178216 n=1 Tax=Photinus pyralis TaxID=7054 RepID=UPI00126716DF|nr:uncharacterized protein LOC116178216 [Photinus pyralis]